MTCRARMNLAGCPEPILSRVRSECGDVREVFVKRCDAQSIPEHIGATMPAPPETLA